MKQYRLKREVVKAVRIPRKVGHLGIQLKDEWKIKEHEDVITIWTGIPDVYVNISKTDGFIININIKTPDGKYIAGWGGDYLVVKDNRAFLLSEADFFEKYEPKLPVTGIVIQATLQLPILSLIVAALFDMQSLNKGTVLLLCALAYLSISSLIDIWKKYKENY